ncbi:MAG: hypothetical protein AB1689_24135 [Thermodesulfobacteriota bacterium]
MPVDHRKRSVRHGVRGNPHAPADLSGAVVTLLYGLGVMLALIALYLFSDAVGALIEWGRSSEPWWRP